MSEGLTEDSEYPHVVRNLRAINRDRHNRLKKFWGSAEAYSLVATAVTMGITALLFGVTTAIGVGLGALTVYGVIVLLRRLSLKGSLIMARKDREDMRAVWRED